MNNQFIALCKNSENKNIDKNFVQALQALIFLNGANTPELINQSYNVSYKINVDDKTKEEKWFKEKIADGSVTSIKSPVYESSQRALVDYLEDNKHHCDTIAQGVDKLLTENSLTSSYFLNSKKCASYEEETYTAHEKMHIGEFLVKKLSENFRRLYSAHKDGGKVAKEYNASIPNLKEQQKHIYAALETVSPYVNFDRGSKIYNNIFMGKIRNCNHAEAFFYLSLHQYLDSENTESHLKFFRDKFDANDIRPQIFKDMHAFSYPDSTAKIAKEMISTLPDSFFQEIALFVPAKKPITGRFVADLFVHCAKKDIQLSSEAKVLFLKGMFHQYSYWGKQPAQMAESIIKDIENYVCEIRPNFTDLGEIYPDMINKNCAATIAMHVIEKITDPVPFVSSLSSRLEDNQKAVLFGKYDFSDQKVMLSIARKIIEGGGNTKNKKMQEFISMTGDYLENETIANILAMDFSTIEIINPLFMTRKLSQELGSVKQDDAKTLVRTKMKI